MTKFAVSDIVYIQLGGRIMNLSKTNIKKIAAIILFAVVAFLAIQNLDNVYDGIQYFLGIISPFVLGIVIAFILNVPMRFFEKHLFKKCVREIKNEEDGTVTYVKKGFVRPISIIMSVVLVFVVITGIVFVVIPQLTDAVIDLIRGVERVFPEVQKWLGELFKDDSDIRIWIASINLDYGKLIDTALDFLKSGAGDVLNGTVTAAKAVISGVFVFFIGFIFSLYMLAKKENLLRQIRLVMNAFLSDKVIARVEYVAKISNEIFSNFISVQCLEAVILGTMFFIAMSIIGLPYSLLISVLVAFMALIPIFGAFISCFLGTFLVFTVNPTDALIFLIMFVILQQLEANLIYPRVVGNRVGLSPIWVLTAVTVGSSLMGIVGILVFIPLTSVVYVVLRKVVYTRIEKKKKEAVE